MTAAPFTVARPVSFFPSETGGKYHAVWLVAGTPVCGAALAIEANAPITVAVGDPSGRVHPIVCRRCLAMTAHPDRTSQGVRQ